MTITKLGHCCLQIAVDGVTILTDPGNWAELPATIPNLDIILITHEHEDHLHIESLKRLIKNSPDVMVVTNKSVGELLDQEQIEYTIVSHNDSKTVLGIELTGFGQQHAAVYQGIIPVENTGYLIENKLFYPGDAFTNPGVKVEVLALPVAGPWLHMREAIDYGKLINPQLAFPVHDGMLKHVGPFHFLPEKFLGEVGIKFKPLLSGDELSY